MQMVSRVQPPSARPDMQDRPAIIAHSDLRESLSAFAVLLNTGNFPLSKEPFSAAVRTTWEPRLERSLTIELIFQAPFNPALKASSPEADELAGYAGVRGR
jgi:hypothetical protein